MWVLQQPPPPFQTNHALAVKCQTLNELVSIASQSSHRNKLLFNHTNSITKPKAKPKRQKQTWPTTDTRDGPIAKLLYVPNYGFDYRVYRITNFTLPSYKILPADCSWPVFASIHQFQALLGPMTLRRIRCGLLSLL